MNESYFFGINVRIFYKRVVVSTFTVLRKSKVWKKQQFILFSHKNNQIPSNDRGVPHHSALHSSTKLFPLIFTEKKKKFIYFELPKRKVGLITHPKPQPGVLWSTHAGETRLNKNWSLIVSGHKRIDHRSGHRTAKPNKKFHLLLSLRGSPNNTMETKTIIQRSSGNSSILYFRQFKKIITTESRCLSSVCTKYMVTRTQ